MKIAEKRERLHEQIHVSTQCLETISDLELLSMDPDEDDDVVGYEDMIDIADEAIDSADDEMIQSWYEQFVA